MQERYDLQPTVQRADQVQHIHGWKYFCKLIIITTRCVSINFIISLQSLWQVLNWKVFMTQRLIRLLQQVQFIILIVPCMPIIILTFS